MEKRHDLYKYDAAERQRVVLDYVLKAEQTAKQPTETLVSVAVARHELSVHQAVTHRNETRLLFISEDTSLLNQTQQTLDGYLDLSEVFDEVHIVILRAGIKAKDPVLRVAPNVWMYIATAKYWWWTPYAALRLIREQMVFADGFRPDLIVARDAYESALVAQIISREFARPSQLHVVEDFTDREFLTRSPQARWRRLLARYLTGRFLSIRTATDHIQNMIAKVYPMVPDVATLPRFNSYQAPVDITAAVQIRERYPQFEFLFVYVGPLGHHSTCFQVIEALQALLGRQTVGLIIVGDGSARAEFQKKTEVLGVKKQVVFEKSVSDISIYLAAADVAIVSDIEIQADEIIIQAAGVGVPLIMTQTPSRADLFTDGESALFYIPDEVRQLATQAGRLFADKNLQQRLANAAALSIERRLYKDPEAYRLAYRMTVEEALFVGNSDTPMSDQSSPAGVETTTVVTS